MRYLVVFLLLIFSFWSYAQCPNTTLSSSQDDYCISDFIQLSIDNTPKNAVIRWDLGSGWDTANTEYATSPHKIGVLDVRERFTLSDGTPTLLGNYCKIRTSWISTQYLGHRFYISVWASYISVNL